MVRSTVCLLSMVLLAGSVGVSRAQQPLPEDPQFENAKAEVKVFKPLIGKWARDEFIAPRDYPDLSIEKGDKFDRVRVFRWDLASSLLVDEIRLENASGKEIVVLKSISG